MNALVSATAIVAIAGSSFGLGESVDRSGATILSADMPGVTITKREMLDPIPTGVPQTIYDSLDAGAGYLSFSPTSGSIGIEDYGTTLSPSGPPNGTPTDAFDGVLITEYQFVGGVQQSGGILFFDFYFNDFSFANSFGVQLDTPGNFLYTINFPAPVGVPTEGFHGIFANDNPNFGPITTGQWFLSDVGANPTVGHNDLSIDNGFNDYGAAAPDIRDIGHNFALIIPTPGAAAMLGLAGLGALRRRR